MKRSSAFILVFLLFSCKGKAELPVGFEHVSKDGNAHFVLVSSEYLGDRKAQREAGRTICRKLYDEANYCEVYYFSKREEIPTKFPMINRINPVGYFEIKNNHEKFKALNEVAKTIN